MADSLIQRELSGSTYKYVTESGVVKTGQGVLRGILITSTNSGTLKIYDGTEASVAATSVLTSAGACVPASHAESVLTADGTAITDGKIVTIGTTVYRFKTTIAQAYDVAIGASAAVSLDNLKAAINGSGTAGTEYYAGTVAHPGVVATDNANTTQKIVARVPGVTPNAYPTTTDETHLSWADTTLGGGTGDSNPGVTTAAATITIGTRVYMAVTALSETSGATAIANQVLWETSEAVFLDNLKQAINGSGIAGTDYSTGTTENTQVYATTNTNTEQTIVAKTLGTSGNAIATTTTLANYSWTSTVMASGAGATGKIIADTITPAAGSNIAFDNTEFENGLYITVGGTAIAATVKYK